MRHEGLHSYRLHPKAGNQTEAEFALQWKAQNDLGHTLDYLLGNGRQKGDVTPRDEQVAATVAQWLGSPVGLSFLREVLSKPEFKAFRKSLPKAN